MRTWVTRAVARLCDLKDECLQRVPVPIPARIPVTSDPQTPGAGRRPQSIESAVERPNPWQ